jgi:hypothetical protein
MEKEIADIEAERKRNSNSEDGKFFTTDHMTRGFLRLKRKEHNRGCGKIW